MFCPTAKGEGPYCPLIWTERFAPHHHGLGQDVAAAGPHGATAESVPDVAERASPIVYADATDPAPLLVHGGGDGIVLPEQSRALQARLEALGVASTYVEVPLGPHAFAGITEDEDYRRSSCTTLAYLEDVFAR